MYRISLLLTTCLILGGGPVSQAQAPHVGSLDSILDAPPYDRAFWGVLVTGPDGAVIFERNADRLFVPASSNKLVVSALAAVLLDSTFTTTTTVFASGPITAGVLSGDLVIHGEGDPGFGERCYGPDTTGAACETMWSRMHSLADSIAATGLTHVTGALVGDGSYFEATIVHPDWQSYDLNWWYAAPVSGLGFNDNSLNVTWGPGASVGAPARIEFEPDLGDFLFENRTATVDSTGSTTVDFFRVPGTRVIWAEGTVTEDREPRTEYFAVSDPNLFFAAALRAALAERGVSFGGPTLATTDPARYAGLLQSEDPLVRYHSRPLEDLVYPILNSSQNWFAELLLKNLGARFGTAGSWEAGLALEAVFLTDSVGVDSTAFELHDGSGLAAANVLTPRAFVQLLGFMEDHPRNAPFMRALPRSGATGSLRRRFLGTPLEGRVFAKTGSINHMNSLNGYVETDQGLIKFSVMVNNQTAGSAASSRRIDEFLVALLR